MTSRIITKKISLPLGQVGYGMLGHIQVQESWFQNHPLRRQLSRASLSTQVHRHSEARNCWPRPVSHWSAVMWHPQPHSTCSSTSVSAHSVTVGPGAADLTESMTGTLTFLVFVGTQVWWELIQEPLQRSTWNRIRFTTCFLPLQGFKSFGAF